MLYLFVVRGQGLATARRTGIPLRSLSFQQILYFFSANEAAVALPLMFDLSMHWWSSSLLAEAGRGGAVGGRCALVCSVWGPCCAAAGAEDNPPAQVRARSSSTQRTAQQGAEESARRERTRSEKRRGRTQGGGPQWHWQLWMPQREQRGCWAGRAGEEIRLGENWGGSCQGKGPGSVQPLPEELY